MHATEVDVHVVLEPLEAKLPYASEAALVDGREQRCLSSRQQLGDSAIGPRAAGDGHALGLEPFDEHGLEERKLLSKAFFVPTDMVQGPLLPGDFHHRARSFAWSSARPRGTMLT
jgi:hypothetical protein